MLETAMKMEKRWRKDGQNGTFSNCTNWSRGYT